MEKKKRPLRIGESLPRVDAYTKVTGREKYAADYYDGDFLWAGVKRAGIPHGLIKVIHVEKARAIPGIIGVLTYKNVEGPNRAGVVRQDQPVLADTKVRYAGDAVALVIARDQDTLRTGLEAITVDYEPLPAVIDPEEALKPGSPQVHSDQYDGNLIRGVTVTVGTGEAAFAECDTIAEETFEVPLQEHAYLETEAGWACLDDEGMLLIVASTQTPFRDCREISHALGFPMEKIRVIAPFLGGAFGGKDGVTVQCLLGLAALHAKGQPVKMWWDREESFLAGVKRLSARMRYSLGAKKDGSLHALSCRLYFDGGPYAGLGGEIMTLGAEHAGSAYSIPNVSIKGWCAYTNNPLGGPFRGFGVPQVTAAMEQMVDILAAQLGLDPIAMRLKNAVRRNDRNCVGITLTHSTGIQECLQRLSDHPLWKERHAWKALAGPESIRGVGIAAMAHAMGYPPIVPDVANAKIELTLDGTILVYVGIVDMGQGNASSYLHIAGDILGQDASTMQLVLPDTARTLQSGSSSASRCTYVYGNAMIEAAHTLKNRIITAAQGLIQESKPMDFTLFPGVVKFLPGDRTIDLSEVARYLNEEERVCTGFFQAPALQGMDDVIYMGPHTIYSYGAHLVYLEVDKTTGEVAIKEYLAVTDAGRILNPQIYEQQIQGGIAQGIGYALLEDIIVKNGLILTSDLSTYKIPTTMDLPLIKSAPVEIEEESGPYGIKGVGEISISGPLPAIANALCDGCGIRVLRSPFTAERVWKALRGRAG